MALALLVSALCVVPDVTRSVTMDLKAPGNPLYVLGETRDELGGSHFLMTRGEIGANVPQVRPEEAVATFRALEAAMDAGLVRSCHDLSEGGLAVALAECAFAGGIGAEADLGGVPRPPDLARDDVVLFSETQSRFLVEVEAPGFGRAAENRWTITDRNGRVVASREVFEDDNTYRDRVQLDPGAYTFEFLDSEEDGLIRHWWLRGSDPEKMGENGALRILGTEGEVLLDLGYDFAEKRTLRFFVGQVY